MGRVGDVFSGRYELVDPLGEGGGGHVWRVWDRSSGQYLAAKVLRQVDAGSLLRFMREQSVRIEHPHVLTPMGWAGEDNRVLFTMPVVPGGSVATLLGDYGSLPPRWVATLLEQLLQGLAQIHGQGVVHRDVKPANLLLDATGAAMPRLRLSDFGVAAGVDEPRLTRGPGALGTHGYVAPECLRDGWDPDPRADLYAVGMTAVEMLTGGRPEARPDVGLALRYADVPLVLSRWVQALAEADPADRPVSATEAALGLRGTGLVAADPADLPSEIEIFDQLPPLPPGWSEAGPVVDGDTPASVEPNALPAPAVAQERSTATGSVSAHPVAAAAPSAATSLAQSGATAMPPASQQPDAAAGSPMGVPTPSPPGPRRPPESAAAPGAVLPWVALTLIGVLLLVVAAMLALG